MTSTVNNATIFSHKLRDSLSIIDRQERPNRQYKHVESASVAPHVWDVEAPVCR